MCRAVTLPKHTLYVSEGRAFPPLRSVAEAGAQVEREGRTEREAAVLAWCGCRVCGADVQVSGQEESENRDEREQEKHRKPPLPSFSSFVLTLSTVDWTSASSQSSCA